MAEGVTLGQAIVFLRGDRRGLDKDLDEGEKKTKSWAARLGGHAARLLGGAIVAGAAAAAGAVAGIGIAAFSMSSNIDQAVKEATAQLGFGEVAAEEFGAMLATVYGEGFGESLDDVSESLGTVINNLDPLMEKGEDFMVSMTEQAIALRDAFGIDVAESTRTASILMARMGISGEEAMNMITAGFQNGLNSADDLLDTLNEYADDFAEMGFSAEETLRFLNRGLEAGIFNTDKIGDALNEFKVNLKDPAVLQSLSEIDGGLAGIVQAFHDGRLSARDAFAEINERLADMEDPIARDQAGVLLFRSMWEDLGAEAILALGDMEGGMLDISGAGDKLMAQYDNLPSLFEGMKRRALLAFTPLGDKLLEIANEHMPLLEGAFTWIEDKLPGIVEGALGVLGDLLGGAQDLYNLLFKGDFTGLFGLTEDDPIVSFLLNLRETVLSLVGGGFGFVKAWLDENWPTVQAVVLTVLTVIQEAIGAVVDVFKQEILPAFIEIYNQLTFALQDLGLEWDDVWKAIGTAVKIVAGIVGAILLALVGTIVGVVTGIARAIAAAIKAFREMGQHIGGIIRGVVQFFTGLFEFFKRLFAGDFPGALDALKFAFEGAWLFIESMVGLIWASIKGTFNVITAFIGGFIDSFVGFFKNLYDRLVGRSIITDLVNEILSLFKSINLLEIGRKMIQGFINGINEKREELKAKVRELAEGLPDWVKAPLGIQSPSAVFAAIGENVMAGLAQGLADAAPLATAQLQLAAGRLAVAGAGTTNYNQYFFGIPGLGTQREAGDAGYRLHQDLKRRGQA